MMRSTTFYIPVFTFLLLCSLGVKGQPFDFKVGSAQTGLEPESNVISLSLAGYGGPRDGRFTLDWKTAGSLDNGVSDMVFSGASLFVLKEEAVWAVDPEKGPTGLLLTDQNEIQLLAADAKKLYGLAKNKEVLTAAPGKALKWKKTGYTVQVEKPVAFVLLGTDFVVADDRGGVWRARHPTQRTSWQKIGTHEGIVDLVVHSGRLYALTKNNELLYFEPDGNLLRIAIKNDKNYPYDLCHVAMKGNVLYGLDEAGRYYRAGQYSDGNLTAGAVSIKKGSSRVLIIGLDVCGIDADFSDLVKGELSSAYHLPSSAILINSSHTHYAPVTQRWTTWGPHCQRPDSLYLYSTVKKGILNAVRLAVKSEKEANLFFGRDEVVIGRNRNLRGDNLPYDKSLDVLRIDYKNQQAPDVLFLAGCHPVFNSNEKEFYKISANYPGTARELLSRNAQIRNPIFLQGCGGDINPIDADHKVTGKKLADAVSGILKNGNMTRIRGEITHFMDTVSFPVRPWAKQDILALKKEKEQLTGDIYAEERVRWANLMLSYYDKGNMPAKMPVYIQTLNIGNWKLVGVSRETTTEYSIAIKNLWPDKLVTVAGYCNDVSSYLPTSRHIKAKIYEGLESFFWYSQPNTFPENVHEVIIDSMRLNNR